MSKLRNLSAVINVIFFLIIILFPKPAQAQWPPFRLVLEPTHEDGQITYQVGLYKEVDWNMIRVAVKIPIPEGTRYISSDATPGVDISFNGEEVTFFIANFDHTIRTGDAQFVIEITDPALTVITTQAWINWEGDQPGDYLKEDTIDISKPPLVWNEPGPAKLRLETEANIEDDIVTYSIYPTQESKLRMWDIKIVVPIPEGATYVSAYAPAPFDVTFDGREVTFFIIELAKYEDVGALEVKISDVSQEARLYTWATWKNSSERVGINEVAQEETRTPDLIFQLDSAEKVRTDATGDVPFSNYDITNVAFKDFTSAFKVTFYTLEDMGPVGSGDYLDLRLYIDRDCNVETGQIVNGIGSDFYIRYRHDRGQAQIRSWDENEETWQSVTAQLQVENLLGDKRVGVWVPYDILNLENEKQFCWRALSRNYREEFASGLPTDYVTPPSVLTLAPSGELPPAALPIVSSTEGTFIDIGDTWQYLPGSTESDPNWPNVDFDDSHWLSGPTGIGYGTGKLATDLDLITNDIQDSSSSTFVEHTSKETGVTLITLSSGADSISLYTRRAFTVTSPLTQLMLEIDYKDGFVAYLNGTEVARRGFEDGLPINYDTFATQREANTVEIIDLSDYISELRTDSPNVLAIQVHRSVDVPLNLFVAPKLIWHYTSQHTNVEQKDDNSAVNTDLIPSVPTPPLLSLSDISGKLAVPILDEYEANYNTHVYSVPNGEEIDVISYARQPNFHPDGQRLLINREGGGVENVFEYNIETEIDKPVSDSPNDWHPFYDPWGNRVVYGNDQLAMSGIPVRKIENGEVQRHNKTGEIIYKGVFAPFIFVQCSINPPHLEEDALCRDIAVFDVLIPAGQMGDLQGTHPVWTSNDLIAFKGCNSWAGSQLCGIFTVPSASTKRLSNGFIPKQLTRDTSDTPSDTKGNFITFTSQRDGDWEAYIMDLNGNGLQNLSNSPESNDGIPTISPDQQWVAFVSDRGGQWAIWAVPSSGGTPQKLFDLPTNSPWGDQDLSWLTERISWGP